MSEPLASSASVDAPTPMKHPFLMLFQPPEIDNQTSTNETYWKDLKGHLHSHLHSHLKTHHKSLEEAFIDEMNEMDPDLRAPNCICDNGFTTLHYAAALGLTTLAKQMLAKGYKDLLYKETRDGNGIVPIKLAMDNEEYAMAAVLMRNMKERSFYLFTRRDGNVPQIILSQLLQKEYEVRKQVYNATTQDEERLISLTNQNRTGSTAQPQVRSISMDDTDSRGKLHQLILAVMDICGEEEIESVLGMNGDADNRPLNSESSCYFFIRKYKIKELQKHKCFQFIARKKWREYGLMMQVISFLMYLVFTAILTTALALAAKTTDPTVYDDPIDGFRLFCEILAFGYTICDGFSEIHDLRCSVNRRNLKKYSSVTNLTSCLYASCLHLKSWDNLLDCLAILCTLLIIPFRSFGSNVQWTFTSLAYLFHTLRIFKFAVLFETVAIYVHILLRVIKRDVLQFVLVFAVIALAFGGGFHFALRGEETTGSSSAASVDNSSLEMNSSETSELPLTWRLGLRVLAEGSVVEYTSYMWLAISLYWLMVFTISVILLNLLIAQFNKTYENETADAATLIAMIRLEISQKLETAFWRTWAQKLRVKRVQRIIDTIIKHWEISLEHTEDTLQEEVMKLKAQYECVQKELNELNKAVGEIKDILLQRPRDDMV